MQDQTIKMQDGTELDAKAVKVMKAIRQIESGGDYNAVGDGGDAKGAFQFNEKTGPGWKNLAKQYLGDENAKMDKANQNKVAYKRIKSWKDEGKQPEEIAALWNGAKKDASGKYTYNNPAYGEKFRKALMGESFGVGPSGYITSDEIVKPTSPTEPPKGLLGTKKNDSLYGKIIDNSITRGMQRFGSAITGGGTDVLGQAIGTLGGAAYTKGKDVLTGSKDYQYYNLSAPSPLETAIGAGKTLLAATALKGGGGLLSKVMTPKSALSNEYVAKILEPLKLAKNVTKDDIWDTLAQSLSSAPASKKGLIEAAIKEVTTPALLKRVLSGTGRWAWKGAKAIGWGIAASLGLDAKDLTSKIIGQ